MIPKSQIPGRQAGFVVVLLTLVSVSTCFAQANNPEKRTQPPATQPTSRPAKVEANPPAKGFNSQESDPAAVALADLTMKAMGGRKAWDETRYITWNFFGSSKHVWDKHTGEVRIEWTDRESGAQLLVLMNINTVKGRAWRAGNEITESKALAEMLKQGKSKWINDGYWLFMPYKLKDTGVTLKMAERDKSNSDSTTAVVELTFENVGNTPQNKYHVYIGLKNHLVKKWEYFANADDDEPRFAIPWNNWKRYGRIMLSGDRGERNGKSREISEIAVFDELPESIFTSPEPVNWDAVTPAESNP
ncbi:MAG: hypothetical protein IH984_01920 [Planctomycetes bacterium]|nr:hypothetical protein [Planctomycetota bacterium]